MQADDRAPIDQLLGIMRRLRDPESGCAWDVKQDFHTIAPYTLEEAYEVVDAIERGDLDDLKNELGDLLLQVVFHSQMASEQSAFDFDDVTNAISEKMIRRHPHVFGDTVFESEDQLKASWEAIKLAERQDKHKRLVAEGAESDFLRESSVLDGVATNLPSLKRADKIQTRASRAGFDWPEIDPVWEKISEEMAEVQDALATDDAAAVEDEIGDLLFSVVNLARHAGVDSETALRKATGKFSKRFKKVEQLVRGSGRNLSAMSLDELDYYWEQSKNTG